MSILFGGKNDFISNFKYESLGEFILERLSSIGNDTVLINGLNHKKLSGQDIFNGTLKTVNYLLSLDIKKGDVICLAAENRLETPIITFACYCIGAIIAPINPTYSRDELHHILKILNPKMIIFSPAFSLKFIRMTKIQLVSLGRKSTPNSPFYYYADDINKYETSLSDQLPKINLKEDVALILSSSGTTGLPKCVALTQINIVVGIAHQYDRKHLISDLVVLSLTPWFHAIGCITMIGCILNNMKFVFIPKFQSKLFLTVIDYYKISMAFFVPPLLIFLEKNPLVLNYNLSSLKIIFVGGSKISAANVAAVQKRLPNIEYVFTGYGMTEATLGLACQWASHNKPGSLGTIRTAVYGKIVDPETNKILGPNEIGELVFKGPMIMKGYWNNEEATKHTIRNGWLHSGDIGYYDESGNWYIVDRLKELIKYKGFQVAPAEIEAILVSHNEIEDAAVIGIPDEYAGELPLAFIVKKSNSSITEAEIKNYVAGKVSSNKQLHGGIRFISHIPRNPASKILKRQLRSIFEKELHHKL